MRRTLFLLVFSLLLAMSLPSAAEDPRDGATREAISNSAPKAGARQGVSPLWPRTKHNPNMQ